MNFFKVTQFALTVKGQKYMKNNPTAPWGCELIDEELVRKFFREKYDKEFKGYKEQGDTKELELPNGKTKRVPRRGVKGLVKDGEVIPFEDWVKPRIEFHFEEMYHPNPKFFISSVRGYQKDTSNFDKFIAEDVDWDTIHWITEGYYERFRISNKCMALDVFPNADYDHFYHYDHKLKRLVETEAWDGFAGNTIGVYKMEFLDRWLPLELTRNTCA